MTFTDYARTLKNFFKRPVSDVELCQKLFDAIIKPLDLRNRKGEVLTFDKADISRIMNRKKNIPKHLQAHIHDKVVCENLHDYFEDNITTELLDDTSELRYRMMNLIKRDKNISPARKEKLRLAAKQEAVSLFLA